MKDSSSSGAGQRPLSIGIVCFPSFGGSGVVATELAMGLAERGHRVHLLATALPVRAARAQANLTFHEIQVPDYPLFEHAPYGLAVAGRLFDVCRAHRLDLVHAHYAVPHAASGILARQLLGESAFKIVTALHGTDVTRIGADPSYRSIVAASVAASDAVTVPSSWLRREAYERLGVPAGVSIDVFPNFVDTARFAPAEVRDPSLLQALFPGRAEPGPVLFHVSNFRPVKRTGDLVEVLALVRRDVPARLVLVGDGPEREAIEERALAHGVREHVAFLGKRHDFAAQLRHADAFLLPSETESFGVAALEALSSGVPVFGYQVGGLPELVTPDVGHLVPPFDVEALAHAVVARVADPAARQKLAEAARTRALERFRREPALDRYERFFRGVVDGAPRVGDHR